MKNVNLQTDISCLTCLFRMETFVALFLVLTTLSVRCEPEAEAFHSRNLYRGIGKTNCRVRRYPITYAEYRRSYLHWSMLRFDSCGRQGVDFDRIRKGQDAPKGSWPWQAEVITWAGGSQCGGTLIHSQWVLTAAHCLVRDINSTTSVYLGLTSRAGRLRQQAAQKILHPGYDSDDRYIHDVALLRLWPPIANSLYIYPACLPPRNASAEYLAKPCYISGIGSTGGDKKSTHKSPHRLQQLKVKVMSDRECGAVSGVKDQRGYTYRPDPARHICIQYNKTERTAGSCTGDSGGPLSCKFKDGKYYVMGVTHYGESGCRKQTFPDLFTRVALYRDWIDETMDNESF